MKRLAIIGSGDLGQQIAYYVTTDKQFQVVGFFDDYKEVSVKVNQYRILGGIDQVLQLFSAGVFDQLFVAIGYKHMTARARIYEQFKGIIPFAKFIHSTCLVDHNAIIEDGVGVYPGCIIDRGVQIKENVLLNIGCCIAHDSIIGSHSFLSPRVAIAGFVEIGAKNIIGINTTIIDGITTASNVQFGGGTVVINTVEKAGLYVGNPAKFIR